MIFREQYNLGSSAHTHMHKNISPDRREKAKKIDEKNNKRE